MSEILYIIGVVILALAVGQWRELRRRRLARKEREATPR